MLWGLDEHIFDKEGDLVAVGSVDTDRLNHLLITYFGWLFKVSLSQHRLKCNDRSKMSGTI